MLGAIAGDIIGSIYEGNPLKISDFPLFSPHCRFTDDTVLTVATAEALLKGLDYATVYRAYGRRYPNAGYGGTFIHWILDDQAGPYQSWGNGSAMRVSPVGWAGDTVAAVLAEAERSAAVTHNHPEGIKGAQATALAVYLARTGHDKAALKQEIEQRFGYNLSRSLAAIRPGYRFDVSCQGSVPEAIIAFLEAADVEENNDHLDPACFSGYRSDRCHRPSHRPPIGPVRPFTTKSPIFTGAAAPATPARSLPSQIIGFLAWQLISRRLSLP